METPKTYIDLSLVKENTNSGSVPLTPSELKSLQEDMDQAFDIGLQHFPGAVIEPFEEVDDTVQESLQPTNKLAIIKASDHPPTVPYPALLVRSGKAWRDLQRTVTYGEV